MSNSYEAVGKVIAITPTQSITTSKGSEFKKRDLVIEIEDGQYPQQVKFQVTQDRCSTLDAYKQGDELRVKFNLRGRPSVKYGVTNYFTNLDAWRVELASTAQQPQSKVEDDVPF